jgi:hypothetical protein
MQKFSEFITEDRHSASLTIWDIDDTLFRTKTKVHVVKDGKRIHSMTPAEFNVYDLKPGESFDFSEFRSSAIFYRTARPIGLVFRLAKQMLARFKRTPQKEIAIITARTDLDDKQLFLKTFKKYGFDIKRVHVHRAGNLGMPGPAAKAKIARDYLNSGKYTIARMFDDAVGNLNAFLALKSEFPDVTFEAFFIHEDGTITRHQHG